MTAELTIDFDEPFIGSSGASSGSATPIPPDQIGIDGRPYLLDTQSNDYRREGVEVVQQRNTTSNRDLLLLPQNVWRHQDESWHLGAGQKNLDREDSMQYRYSRSYGINPWTKYEVSLLNETTKFFTLTTTDKTFLQVHNGSLVAVWGTTSRWWATTGSSPVTLALGASSGNAISVTYDGDAVIVLTDLGKVYRLTDSTTSTLYAITPPVGGNPVTSATFIAYAKGYLIMGVGNQLWNITAPTAVLVYTSPVTGFEWVGAAEGTNAIYLAGGSGDKSLIHRVAVKEDGTGLNTAITAATMPDGEVVVSIGAYLGYVFVGSTKGIRMATPASAAGDLVLGALIDTGSAVYAFEGQGQFVWATGNSIDPVSDAGVVDGCPPTSMNGLWRMDLTTFTISTSTPAYATDIVAPGETGKNTRSVVTWGDKRVFSVDNGGIYLETDTKMAAGWLAPGRVSFSVEDLKTGLYAQMKWEPLYGTVALDLSADNGPSVRVLNWSIAGTVSSGNVSLNGMQFSRMDPRYVLYRDMTDTTKGPTLTRFELRARAVKGSASRWYLPILNHESVDFNGVPDARDVNAEFDRIHSLITTGKMFTLQEGRHVYQCVAVDFKWFPQKLTEQGGGWQGVYVLICEEVR